MPIPHSRPGRSGVVRSERVEQRVDAVEAVLRAGLDPGRLVVMSEDPAVEGRDRDVDARRPEVGDQDVAAVGVEGQLARRPPAGARPDVALADQPAFDQLADPLGDDRPAEPGPGDQLGARPRSPEADLVEDQRRARRATRRGAARTAGLAGIAVGRAASGIASASGR